MQTIVVSVDDATYKRASEAAAELDTSVSALLEAYLEQLSARESDGERLKRSEREIRSQIMAFGASDRLSRDEVHRRSR